MTQSLLDLSLLEKALHHATQVALEAGAILLDYLEDPSKAQLKEQADLEVERLIRTQLCRAFPDWGFRAEEEPHLNKTFADERPMWLVDPNDGTSAFLKGERGASVSIALIFQKRPILGVVFAYAAPNGNGDLFTWAEDCDPLKRNGAVVIPNWTNHWTRSIHFISNSADQISKAYQEALTQPEGQAHYRVAPGIAYRLALCAVGEGETAVSLASPRDFDFAAGHALLKGAGGELFDEKGRPVSYNHSQPTRLACSFGGYVPLAQKLSQLDWNPVLRAKINHKKTIDLPFLQPKDMSLSNSKDLLDQIQGSWWGWHLGHLIQKHQVDFKNSELMNDLALHYGGDEALIQEARDWMTEKRSLEHCKTLITFLNHYFSSSSDSSNTEQSPLLPVTPEMGALWGSKGRSKLNQRMISSFLAHRQNSFNSWLVDGDRLAEQLLVLLKQSKNLTFI